MVYDGIPYTMQNAILNQNINFCLFLLQYGWVTENLDFEKKSPWQWTWYLAAQCESYEDTLKLWRGILKNGIWIKETVFAWYKVI